MKILDEALFDKIDDLAEELGKEFTRIKKMASDLAIEKNQDILDGKAGARNSGILIKKQIEIETNKAITKFEKQKSVLISEIDDILLAYEITLSKADIVNIEQKISLISKDLLGQTGILAGDVQEILLGNLGKGIPFPRLVEQLTSLYPAYARHAYTIVNTGLQRLYVDTTAEKYAQRGYEFYTWAGPDDMLTRENPCKRWVWHYFTGAELARLRSVKMRLYNCRHSIAPITAEQAKTMPRGNINAYSPYVPKKGLKK